MTALPANPISHSQVMNRGWCRYCSCKKGSWGWVCSTL